MTQTLALFVDAYRDLNSKRLFWVVLALSALVVAAFAGLGLNDEGITLFGYQFHHRLYNAHFFPPALVYKIVFSNLGVGVWLGLLGSLLALISTASLFPDFLTGGSIDLFLAKPIGRLRLFFTKYLTGLLFAALQAAVFCAASFLVLGLRGKTWLPAVFLGVPLMVIFFSYLFAACALFGVLTRSTLASLLLTVLFWLLIWGVNVAENAIFLLRALNHYETGQARATVAEAEARRAESAGRAATQPYNPRAVLGAFFSTGIDESRRDQAAARLPGLERSARNYDVAYSIARRVKAALPKTADTTALMERWLVSAAELPTVDAPRLGWGQRPQEDDERYAARVGARSELLAHQRERSPQWILGTSLAFEAVVLAWGAWAFCRRDF